jgi:cellulose synthase/poly-beta-1,6-N-acetylglucosamine synthase-like glycosyltransferase
MTIVYIFGIVYGLAMLFVLVYSLAQAHLLFHFIRYRKCPPPSFRPAVLEDLPLVTVQLPIYNERYVVERLIESVVALNYPLDKLQIQILDDSTDATCDLILNKIKEYPEIDIQYHHRKNRCGYKAGALKEGLEKAKGEFTAIFDADFVPDPDFLLKTLPHFDDPKVGMVQSRWTHLNKHFSILTQLQAFALDAHFLVEQVGRNRQHAFMNFNGTGGIWRKSCILDSGNWQADTLTEDLDLSYRAQARGWKFVYRPDIASPAELPPVMSAIKSQQYRWTKGGAECARKHLREVFQGDYTFNTKFHAFAHLLNSTVFIAVLLASISSIPLWWAMGQAWIEAGFFKFGAIFFVGFVIIALVYLFTFFSSKGNFWKKSVQVLWQLPLFLAVSMGLSLHNSMAVGEGLMGKRSPFVRTPKFNLGQRNNHWKKNSYLSLKMPFVTVVEGAIALLFLGIVLVSLNWGIYLMLPFHLMLALGYGIVFYTSYKSYNL